MTETSYNHQDLINLLLERKTGSPQSLLYMRQAAKALQAQQAKIELYKAELIGGRSCRFNDPVDDGIPTSECDLRADMRRRLNVNLAEITELKNDNARLMGIASQEATNGNKVAQGWQDIASAPKDGTRVLLYNMYGAGSGHWDKKWHCHFDLSAESIPTHWQPLPEPPHD